MKLPVLLLSSCLTRSCFTVKPELTEIQYWPDDLSEVCKVKLMV